jgi:hypothetical protein
MGNPRNRPKLLPAKLLAIREFLKVGQTVMAGKLQFEILSHCRRQYRIDPARISEYETGRREPNLFVLIAYARLGHIHMETVADDRVIIDHFHTRLGKEFHYPTLSRPAKSTATGIPSKRTAKNETRTPPRNF